MVGWVDRLDPGSTPCRPFLGVIRKGFTDGVCWPCFALGARRLYPLPREPVTEDLTSWFICPREKNHAGAHQGTFADPGRV